MKKVKKNGNRGQILKVLVLLRNINEGHVTAEGPSDKKRKTDTMDEGRKEAKQKNMTGVRERLTEQRVGSVGERWRVKGQKQ